MKRSSSIAWCGRLRLGAVRHQALYSTERGFCSGLFLDIRAAAATIRLSLSTLRQ
jgi:hypothetical protein